ncbi:ribosome biogenesis protein SLX9-domain-containing protein, partial [Phyllosticta paracitricarpa]
FASSKRDKRSIKHSLLLSKITKSAPLKRRRPNKKLVTTLDALADALPTDDDYDGDANAEAGNQGERADAALDVPGAQARILVKNRSLKSRPGALKRKAAVEARERHRFEQNLAEMAKGVPAPPGAAAASTAERWKALRAFIGGTMERR